MRPVIVEAPLRAFLERVDAVLNRATGFGREFFEAPDWADLLNRHGDDARTITDAEILQAQRAADSAFIDCQALAGAKA